MAQLASASIEYRNIYNKTLFWFISRSWKSSFIPNLRIVRKFRAKSVITFSSLCIVVLPRKPRHQPKSMTLISRLGRRGGPAGAGGARGAGGGAAGGGGGD